MAGTGAGATAHMQQHGAAPSARLRLQQRALLYHPPRASTAFSLRSLLYGLLRRTCLSLPAFPLPSALLLSHCLALLTSVLVPTPGDRPHRALHACDQTAL